MGGSVNPIHVQIFLLFLLLDHSLIKVYLFLDLCVLFLLHDELLDEQLSVVLLGLVLQLQLLVFLHELSVLVVDLLGDARDQLQVVVQLVLPVLQVSCLVSLLVLSLFDLLLHFGELTVELPDDVLLLLFLQFLGLRLDPINVLMKLVLQGVYDLLIRHISIVFVAESDSELPLEVVDVLPILLLPLHISLLPPQQVFMKLSVFFDLGVQVLGDLSIHVLPVYPFQLLGIFLQQFK